MTSIGPARARRFARVVVACVLTGVIVAACAGSDDATEPDSAATGTDAATSGSDTGTAGGDTSATDLTTDATDATDVTGESTDASPRTTLAATTTTTTTTIPPTTTEPLSTSELILRQDGLGSALFGADPDTVIQYVSSILGGNTGDTGWVDPLTFAVCDGTLARRVDWGVLSLLFSDLSPYADGRRHFMGWDYGRAGSIGDEPVGLHTEGRTMLGSRVVDLRAEFPDASVNGGEDDLGIPPNFYVNDNFRGLLTGTGGDDVVTVMLGGYGCAE